MPKILKIFFISIFLPNILLANTKFFQEGLDFYKDKKFNKAKFKFEQDIVYNPKNEMSYLYLSKIYKNLDKRELEEQNLETVILLNPKNEEAVYLLALLRIKKSDYKSSNQLIQKFEKICNKICDKKSELNLKLKSIQTN